jgi:pseudouridine-5'-monophosphatase
VAAEYQARQKGVLAGKTGMIHIGDNSDVGEVDDGWAETISSLEEFNYEKYGIDVRF